jgi:hypothetical protein
LEEAIVREEIGGSQEIRQSRAIESGVVIIELGLDFKGSDSLGWDPDSFEIDIGARHDKFLCLISRGGVSAAPEA